MTPLEMISEWRKGCTYPVTKENPEACHQCTVALIDALEAKLKQDQASVSVEHIQVSPDANVERNRQLLLERSVVGVAKYGVTTERSDLSPEDWLQHALEETLDLANYLQALRSTLQAQQQRLEKAEQLMDNLTITFEKTLKGGRNET